MNVVVNWTSSKLGVRLEGWQRCRSGRNSFNHRVLLISRWINVNLQHQSSSTADTHLNLDFFFTESHRWDLSTQQTRCAPSLLLFIEKDSEKEKKMNISVHWYFFFWGEKKWRADDKFSFGLWKPCPPADAIDHTRGDWIFLPGRIFKKNRKLSSTAQCSLPETLTAATPLNIHYNLMAINLVDGLIHRPLDGTGSTLKWSNWINQSLRFGFWSF